MTELVEGVPLNEWLRGEPPAGERHALARRLALALRRLHGAGLAHRDLKAPNILVAGDAADGPRPVLVDLDGLARRRWLTDRRRARDLMRLSVSLDEWGVARATDRLRLLGRYLAGPGVAAPSVGGPRGRELRRWWRRIARMSEAKLARLRAKGTGPIAR